MTEDAPPWREITTDDYFPRARRKEPGPSFWIDSNDTIRGLLQRQFDGEFRLRLVLHDEDLKIGGGKRDPSWSAITSWVRTPS